MVESEQEDEDERDPELTHCPPVADGCGFELVFDPDAIGDTVGGLTRRGWLVCVVCGKGWLTRRGYSIERWRLAKSKRSIETSIGRIRVDGCSDPEALCARLLLLPELELENDRLRRRVAELESEARKKLEENAPAETDINPRG